MGFIKRQIQSTYNRSRRCTHMLNYLNASANKYVLSQRYGNEDNERLACASRMTDLEVEDNRPDETQDDGRFAISDVCRVDVDQLDLKTNQQFTKLANQQNFEPVYIWKFSRSNLVMFYDEAHIPSSILQVYRTEA